MSNKNLPNHDEKVTIGCYISLFLAIIFFSGVAAGSAYFWSFLDFTTLMGSAGKVVGKVAQTEEGIATTLTTMRGVGGSGAIDGFMMAISMIVPGVMLAMGMISVFEHYGALRAAKQLLSPVLRSDWCPGYCNTCSNRLFAIDRWWSSFNAPAKRFRSAQLQRNQ